MVYRPVSLARGNGGIYHSTEFHPDADEATSSFENYMMPPFGFIT